jgi:cytoskeleton protein RodZ
MNAPEAEAPVVAAPPPEPVPSPGALLRAARERAGLGADDLAGQLKLAKGTLEALERDDFAALSEPVYIRGYYRKIAKVLPVAESDLIGAYNARTNKPQPAAVPLRRLPLAGGVAAGTSRHSRGPGLGLIALGLIGVGVLVAVINREPPQRRVSSPAATASQPAPVTAPEPEPTTQLSAAAPEAAPAAPVNDATSEAPAPATPAAVPNQLVLEFTEASFIRVEDSRSKTLAIGLVRGNERHALDGAPPYTVFLGNARNVKVFYGGTAVDFSAHVNAQNDTARFTVP